VIVDLIMRVLVAFSLTCVVIGMIYASIGIALIIMYTLGLA
jgi:hypothetical protein